MGEFDGTRLRAYRAAFEPPQIAAGVVGAAGWIADLMPASATETAADDPPVR